MLDVYHVSFQFEITKDNAAIQLSSDVILITFPIVRS